MRRPATRIALVSVALLLASPLFAQNDQSASLTIRLLEGPSRFHVGEVIRLEMSFTTSTASAYDLNTRNYDRSGRLDMEQFHLTPAGRDPLERYYSIGGFMGGGIGGSEELTSNPRILLADLNEWVAIDAPGHYSLFITSTRVSRRGETRSEPVKLQSNTVEIDVIAADPAWQQQTFISAVTTLNMESSTPEEKQRALRVLRFLDCPDSIVKLVQLLGTMPDRTAWDSIAGLAGARNQSFVVHQLEKSMSDPETALTSGYLYLLTKLKLQLGRAPLGPYPMDDPERQAAWNEQRLAQDKYYREIEDILYEEAAEIVPTKQERARAETVKTLLERPSHGAEEIKPLGGPVAQEAARAFLALSTDDEWNLLLGYWPRLRVLEMLAPLKKLAQQPFIAHPMLRDQVFQRLYDLSPGEAAPLFLAEIAHPHIDQQGATVKAATLGLLSQEALPQFDEILAARLLEKDSRSRDLDAQLVGRFSTASILAKIKAAYQASPSGWSCAAQDGYFSYFLRIEPDFGVNEMARSPSSCLRTSMATVVRMNRWAEVEPGVIAWLNGPDFSRRRSALESLGNYGSPQAKKALWERLRRYRAQWSARGITPSYRPGMTTEENEQVQFLFGMVEALGTAQAWLLSNEEITELEAMNSGPLLENIKRWRWTSPLRIDISWYGDYFQWGINQYSSNDPEGLRAKLAQFPADTRFILNVASQNPRMPALVASLGEIAAARGFQIDYPQSAQ